MKRKICVVTGSRAEYGLLRGVMEEIRRAPELELQVVATGMHLSPEFGLTYREIEGDGFPINRRVDMQLSADTPSGIAKSMGLGLIGFGETLAELQPDLMVVLGDRFEIFAAVAAALIARIPVAHLHGGETTQGAFDEAIRHSITKMAHLHFVAAEPYRRRVIQLGEHPDRVFTVGGLGVDNIKHIQFLERAALEESMEFIFRQQNLLITYHPITLDEVPSGGQMAELLAALEPLRDTGLIFTMPNADTDGRVLATMIEEFVAGRANARAYRSLGQLRYLSCMRQVDAVVGNSSSGLTEAPTLGKATVNIGDRQRGRLRAASIIDCAADRGAIAAAIRQACSPKFRALLKDVRNPYGEGGAAEKIVRILRTCQTEGLVKKTFHDLVF